MKGFGSAAQTLIDRLTAQDGTEIHPGQVDGKVGGVIFVAAFWEKGLKTL